ncbi:MAG: tyrosine-protein phosphatase [Bradyrhizobium sp.]
MIDLHCHLLPGIDDGAKDIDASLAMARMASTDGITVTACTPHILPGVYDNSGPAIRTALERLRDALAQAGIELQLVSGADVHVAPDLIARLRDGRALTLNDTRYFLLEPPHHVLPPRLEDHIFGLQAAGYVPILTHPERLTWLDSHYGLIKRLVYNNVLMQLTAGSVMGRFGRRPRYWADRMLDDGLCHLMASDAHNAKQRAPRLSDAREVIARRLGDAQAAMLFVTRPQAILNNEGTAELALARRAKQAASGRLPAHGASTWSKLLKKVRRAGEVE